MDMKFKSLLVVLVSGLICLPFMSYGQDDIAALRQKAEQGDAAAQYNLGAYYAFGHDVPQDDKEAVKWWRLAAEQGYAAAQGMMGFCYAKGESVPQDYKEAMKWLRLAAGQGHAEAQFNLGGCYVKGQGIPIDYTQALAWFSLAAAQGHEAATKHRTMLLKTMTPEQISESQQLSKKYAEKFMKK
jgi:TPR repeat protein